MAKPTKIFELKGEDFAKGLSLKSSFPVGGLFSSASNYDPFDTYGYFKPSLDSVVVSGLITDTPTVLTSWNDAGTAKIYSHTPNKLYEILDGSPYTTVDKTSEISVAESVTGSIIFKNRYVYSGTTEVRSNVLPVATASDVAILTSAFGTTDYYHVMCVGSDKNLYVGDIGAIHQIKSVTGTATNTANYYVIETGMLVRDMVNDGKYLVVIADNNLSNKIASVGVEGKYRCIVMFFDVNSGRSTADYIYEMSDSYLISAKILDEVVHIFGKNNFWVCNSVTAPRAIFNFDTGSTITEPPINSFQVAVGKNAIYWCGQTNQKVYAYGSMISGVKKVFFQPYSANNNLSAIVFNGTNFYLGTTGTNNMVSITGTGSTRSATTISTCRMFLPQGYTFAFAKVVMQAKLSSGGEVSLGITNSDANITYYTTKLFSAIGAKQVVMFNMENDTVASVKSFNDFVLTVGSNQAIARVEIWAFPEENYESRV